MIYSLLVFAPHLDDAALSCGGLLAAQPGALVVTLLAGFPERGAMSTEWDLACGFRSARKAMEARRAEDRAALAHFQAQPLWLDFCDGQYHQPALAESLAEAILQQVRAHGPQRVLIPMGLFHSDHVLAARACIAALRRRPHHAEQWLGYEDGLYRRLPGIVQQRLVDLATSGITATPVNLATGDVQIKRTAVETYTSQLGPLEHAGYDWRAEISAPERYWLLEADRAKVVHT